MTRILVCVSLLILVIYGSACTPTQVPGLQSTPMADPEAKAQVEKIGKAKLEAARYELQLYEQELKATEEEIRIAEARSGKREVRDGGVIIWKGASDSLLARGNELKEKVIQAKVRVRELELLTNEKN